METLLGEFVKRDKPIIPVILEGRVGNPRLPAFLDSWHKVDMRIPTPIHSNNSSGALPEKEPIRQGALSARDIPARSPVAATAMTTPWSLGQVT